MFGRMEPPTGPFDGECSERKLRTIANSNSEIAVTVHLASEEHDNAVFLWVCEGGIWSVVDSRNPDRTLYPQMYTDRPGKLGAKIMREMLTWYIIKHSDEISTNSTVHAFFLMLAELEG